MFTNKYHRIIIVVALLIGLILLFASGSLSGLMA